MKEEEEKEISASSAIAKESVAMETTVTTAMDTPPTESREEEPMQTSATNEKEGAEPAEKEGAASAAEGEGSAVGNSTESQDSTPASTAPPQETGSSFVGSGVTMVNDNRPISGVTIVDDNKPISEFDKDDVVCTVLGIGSQFHNVFSNLIFKYRGEGVLANLR